MDRKAPAAAANEVVRGREAFARRAWKEAYKLLNAADARSALDRMDLPRLATAAFLIGHDADCESLLTRTFHAFVAHGDAVRAARTAFWLAFMLTHTGDSARAGGWTTRANRLLDEGGHDCVERGYLLVPQALQLPWRKVTFPRRRPTSAQAAALGDRFGDTDLVSLARMGEGRMLIRLGEWARGTVLLDEAMVAVTADEVSAAVAGTVYCSVISACFERYDVGRAQEWTVALSRWCAAQPDLVPYRGECLVYRVEIKFLRGERPDALQEARQACDQFSHSPGMRAGSAH